jgi:ATP-binding cassette subfamily F protein 3
MALAALENVSREYTGRWVLRNACCEFAPGRKVGLIGPNGSGKTTLLRILVGQVRPTSGAVKIAADARIGYVPQRVEFASDDTIQDLLVRDFQGVQDELRAGEAALERAGESDLPRLLAGYQHARDVYDRMGGDHYLSRAEAMIGALGLAGRTEQPVRELSGGEKNVVGMAQALLAEPNLLLLDEPGNHLDYFGLAWLEDFLKRFRGAVVIVSHNRYLLDCVADEIIELENGGLATYPGGYSAYRRQREERLKAQHREFEAYQQRLEHLEGLVRKFGDIAQGHASDASWGKRLRARRSQLERLKAEVVERPTSGPAAVRARFTAERTRADVALQLRGYTKAYDGRVLFEKVDWDIAGGQRWALVGPNGSGKTSLLRDIIAQGRWSHDSIRIGPSLTVGYCAQEQEVLDSESTVYDELLAVPGASHEKVLAILARFLFEDEAVYKCISLLSGGERNRLQLARLMLDQPNFLILDEPTNHLDIPTREAVENALADFKGTLLVVSHDRYFLDRLVDHVAEVRDRGLHFHEGNFTRFWELRQGVREDTVTGRISQRGRHRREEDKAAGSGGQAWLERKVRAAQVRKVQTEARRLHDRVEELEQRKQQLHDEMAGAFTAGENERGHELAEAHARITVELEEATERWFHAQERADGLAGEDTDLEQG